MFSKRDKVVEVAENHGKDDPCTEEEIAKCTASLTKIAKHEQDGFFLIVEKEMVPDGVLSRNLGKISNVNRAFILRSVMKACNISAEEVMKVLLESTLEDKD